MPYTAIDAPSVGTVTPCVAASATLPTVAVGAEGAGATPPSAPIMVEMTSRVISWCETTISRRDTITTKPEMTISRRRMNFSAITAQIVEDAVQIAEDAVQIAEDAAQIARDAVRAAEDGVRVAEVEMGAKMASTTRARRHIFNKYDAICFAK